LKNQQDSIKEQRRLWEEAGTPAEKYAAHLADINAEYAKLHNNQLRDQEIKNLDKQTLEALKKEDPDHHTKIDLYGRTQKFDQVVTGSRSDDVAAQQLKEIQDQNKRNTQWDKWFYDIWQKLGINLGPPTELNI
jgi:hypothetical protein